MKAANGALAASLVVMTGLCILIGRLLRARGRLLLQIEDLEQTEAPAGPIRIPTGVPAGAVLQDFELPGLTGTLRTLSHWSGRKRLLIFFDPRCPASLDMLPHLASLTAEPADGRPTPIVLTTGTLEENRTLFRKFDVQIPVLLQEDMDVAKLYRARATPTGYLVDERGQTASNLLVGAAAIVAAADPGPRHAAPALSSRIRPISEMRLQRRGLAPGTTAPGFRLPLVGGGEVTLEQYRGRRVLLVFSDPECTPCDELAPRLEAFHRSGLPARMLMISRGAAELTRVWAADHNLTFPIALQRGWETSSDYALLAAPIAYLIDETGSIAANAAVGSVAILALATPPDEVLPVA